MRKANSTVSSTLVFALFSLAGPLLALAPGTTTLGSAPNPAVFGAPVILTATVLPATATGKVTFYDGTTVLGVGTLASGAATLTTSLLPSGSRSLRAYYGGDTACAASTSGWVTQTVNAQPADSFWGGGELRDG